MDDKQERQLAFVEALKAVDSIKDEYNNLVYDHYVIPVGLHYYGITNDLQHRKRGSYKNNSLEPYLNQYGWDNISTTIVADGLTRKDAELLEDKLIREGWERGDCINKQGSGGEYRDNKSEYLKQYRKEHLKERLEYERSQRQKHKEKRNLYNREWYQDHKEEKKEYNQQYNKKLLSTPEGKIYNRVNAFNHRNPDKIKETALEAKQKYLETGYIPYYVKNDDIECNYEAYYISALRDIAETVLDMEFDDENNEPIVSQNEEYDEER